jgi:hypothetical protein
MLVVMMEFLELGGENSWKAATIGTDLFRL